MEQINLRKKRIIRITVIFLVVILGCTALARTIYELLLPQVTLTTVSEGSIEKKLLMTGQIGKDALTIKREKVEVKLPQSGIMTKCFVEEGQKVTKGETLLTIALEEDKKEEAQAEYSKAESEINLKEIQNQMAEKKDKKARLEKDILDQKAKMENSEASYEVIEIESQIESKTQEVALNKALLEQGAISESTYTQSEEALVLLQKKKEQLQNDEKEKENEELLKIQEELESVEIEIESLQSKEALEIKKKETTVETSHEVSVSSPISGVIYEMDLAEGTQAGQGDTALVIIPENVAVTLTLKVDGQQADQIQMKQEVNWNLNQSEHQAAVVKKTYDSEKDQMIITCELSEEDINELELDNKTYKTVDISIENQSKEYEQVVANSAIVTEDNQTYIYTIEEEEKPFEVKYFVYKEPVTVVKEGDTVSAVSGTLSSNQKIIRTTSKPLHNGMEVNKKQGGN